MNLTQSCIFQGKHSTVQERRKKHSNYKSLEKTKKARILIGISTNPQTYDLMQKAKVEQSALQFSSAETKEKLGEMLRKKWRMPRIAKKQRAVFTLL